MPAKVVVTKRADDDMTKAIAYLEENVGEKSVDIFTKKVFDTIQKIRKTEVVAYQIVDLKRNIRRCKIDAHNHLYYQIIDDSLIHVLTIFDSRQNPKKLKL